MDLLRNTDGLPGLRGRSRRLLAVFPHPDDEAYGCAGAMARAGSDPDSAAVLLTLTRGEASSYGPQNSLTPTTVGEMREARLVNVATITGIDGLIVGGFPDSRLARVPLDEVAETIGAVIDALRPLVVIGHDPRGVNAHPDHIASHWALRHALLDRPGIRFAMIVYRQEDCEAIKPRLLFATPDDEIDAVLTLSTGEAAKKEACLRAHEALVTLDPNAPPHLFLRPPEERYDFFDENCTVTDLFEAL